MKIDFLKKTRRYWEFVIDDEVDFKSNGVYAENGVLRFPTGDPENVHAGKETFKSEDECWNWIANHDEVWTMEFKANKKINKTLYQVQSKAVEITEQDWELIKGFMIAPEQFTINDIRVYKSYLVNNFPDRDSQRFHPEVIGSFSKTIIGKAKIFSHDWGSPGGKGRYFASDISMMSVDEAIKIVGPQPNKKFREQLQEIFKLDGAIMYMVPRFYIPKYNKELIMDIDAGIISDESIGFRAPKLVEVKDEDGNIKWSEYRNTADREAEAMEGSFVWLGSQYGARIRKSADDNEDDDNLMIEEIKPFPNEHSCRLKDPDKYVSFTRGTRKHEGKEYSIIFGKKKDGKTEEQAYRYKKSIWTASEAGSHCKDHGGSFEAAKEVSQIKLEDIKDLKIRKLCEIIDQKIGNKESEWTDEYINSLEDNCFAVIEPTAKQEDGRSVLRHLPHHTKGASGVNGTLDLPQFRKSLAMLDRIESEDLKQKSKKHLLAHAKKEGIGESTNGGKMEFKIESLGFKCDVESEEKSIQDLQGKVAEKVNPVVEELNAVKATLDSVKKVFGENITSEVLAGIDADIKAGKKYRDYLIVETNKYKCLLGLVKTDEVEADKKFLATLSPDQLEGQLKQFRDKYDKDHPVKSQTPEHIDNKQKEQLNLSGNSAVQKID